LLRSRLFSAALVAVALVAGCGGSRRSAPPLRPPTITESFTLLPCPRGAARTTTIGIEGCLEHQIVRDDRQLDRLARAILTDVHGEVEQARLVATEHAWLRHRAARCRGEAARFAGGTAAPVAAASCLRRMDAQHVSDDRRLLRGVIGIGTLSTRS
jgi:uncharacterized protein YecT (DUF1311 family)